MANQLGRTFLQIWKDMDQDRRRQAATAFFTSEDTASEQRRATGMIATRLNLRPQKAAKLPAERAASYLASMVSIDQALAALLIRSYLFAHQRPMLAMFLDELQIPHQDGVIPDDTKVVPTAEALRAAAARIRGSFAPEDVDIYLATLYASDTATWANLGAALTDEA